MSDSPAIGHNRPPSQIETLDEICSSVGEWLKTNPVVESEEAARDAKPYVDRLRMGLADMEDELHNRTRPKLAEINAIRDEYRSIRKIAEKLYEETKTRINNWAKQEERRRFKAAEEARKKVEEAERLAREAEERERSAAEDAALGVETDITAATKDADAKFAEFQKAQRQLGHAERDTKVKVGGGFGPRMSFHKETELFVTNPEKAIAAMGWSPRVLEAIKTEARAHKKQHGHYPDGVVARVESRFR